MNAAGALWASGDAEALGGGVLSTSLEETKAPADHSLAAGNGWSAPGSASRHAAGAPTGLHRPLDQPPSSAAAVADLPAEPFPAQMQRFRLEDDWCICLSVHASLGQAIVALGQFREEAAFKWLEVDL